MKTEIFKRKSENGKSSGKKKNRFLQMTFVFTLLLAMMGKVGVGQIITFDFAGITGSEATATSNSNNANLSTSTISRGAGLTASANADRYNATAWATTSIANAVSGNNYMEFTINPNSGYQFSVSSIVIQWQRSGTGNTAIALRSSVDSYTSNLDAVKTVTDNTSTQTFTFTFAQANSSTAVTYRLYSYAEATGGTGGPGDGTGNDIVVNGTVTATGSSAPLLTTPTATSITTTGATLGATITADGGATITERGTVWATTAAPTTNVLTEGGTAVAAFSHNRTGFTPNTLYYYRGYAINSFGTGYSSDGTFTSIQNAPTVGTGSAATTSSFTASWSAPTGGGSATYTYTIEVDDDPAFGSVNFTASSIASGTLTANVNTGLSANTTYYYRVKAVNAGGSSAWSANSSGYATLAGPVVTVTGSLANFGTTQCINTSSSEQSYTVSGTNLTANLIITPPAHFEISTGTGGSFAATSPITLIPSGGSVASTTIYVRFKPTSTGAKTGNITHASTGATTINQACAGSGITTPTATATTAISSITLTTASSGGNFSVDGGSAITARGVCWNTSANPTLSNSFSTDGAGTGSYTSSLTGLTANTTYYVRSYATNSCGTTYGTSERTFTTSKIEPTNNATSFTCGSTTSSAITFTWTDAATGSQAPDKYLILCNTTGTFTDPVDGITQANVAGSVANVTQGTQTVTFSGLTSGTTYYFKVFPYTNTTTLINYKTDGTVLTGSCATVAVPLAAISDNGTQISAGNVLVGTTNHILHSFKIDVTVANATLSGLQCVTAGSYASASVTNLKAWYSTNSTFESGTDVLLSTLTTPGTAGTKTFPSFTSQVINSGSTGYIFITADIAVGATSGNTINVNSVTTAHLTMTGATKSGTTTAGGLQTITCNAISSLPWTEGFEGLSSASATNYPGCWSKENGDWQSAIASTNTYNDPKAGTYYITNSYNATNEYIWTPGFTLTEGTPYDFSFWYIGDNLAGWTGDVFYNSSQSSAGATQLGSSFITSGTTSPTAYTKVTNTFTPSSTGTYHFAIRINANASPWYIGFDDFSLEENTIKPEPTNQVTSFTCGTTTSSSIPLSWIAADAGTQAPDGYLLLWSTGSITAPADGTAQADGAGVKNITFGTNAYTVTGLASNTSYNFQIWSYTNSGSNINYKLVSAPTTSCATLTGACITEGFETGLNSAGYVTGDGSLALGSGSWTFESSGLRNSSNVKTGTYSCQIKDGSSYYASTPALSTCASVTFWFKGSVAPTVKYGTTTYSTTALTSNGASAFNQFSATINSSSSEKLYFYNSTGATGYLDDVEIFCITGPTITTTTVTDFGDICTTATSAEKTYNVSGSSLTADITIVPPTGFEISTGTGGSFLATNPITLTQVAGSVPVTPIYVRFKPTLVQSYIGNITHNSAGATEKTTALTGAGVSNAAPSISTPTSASITATTVVLGGNITAEGCSNITERGIYYSTTDGFLNGSGTKVSEIPGFPSTGIFTINVSGLSASTTYYYKAFATNSNGTVYTTQGTFTTDCGSISTLPYTQNFESTWTIPSGICWNSPQTGDSQWHKNSYTTGWSGTSGAYSPTGANSTTGSARFHSYDAAEDNTGDLISPTFDFSGYAGGKSLEFYYINTSGSDILNVYLSTDGGSTYGSSLQTITTASAWTKYTIALGTSTSSTVKIKFTATSDWGTTDIGVDEITISTVKPEPTNHATAFACGTTTTTSIPLTWVDATGGTVPDGYLVKWSSVGYGSIADPVDGTATANGTGALNVSSAFQTADITGLTANTVYYFKIFPYSNSGISINYKIDGTVPTTSCNTQVDASSCTAPGTPSSAILFSNIVGTGMTLNWTSGNGTNRIIIATIGSEVSFVPVTGTTYVANSAFGSGTDLGGGQYCIYNGSGNTMAVTGLTPNTLYTFAIYEYNCTPGIEVYGITSAAASQGTNDYVSTSAITGSPFCVSNLNGTNINVPFTYQNSASYASGTAIFTAQLSDRNGSFNNPVDIGTIVSNASGSQTISALLPAGTVSGTNYKIRVNSATPNITGSGTQVGITIINSPDNVTLNAPMEQSTQVGVSWNAPVGCYDDYMAVVSTTSIAATPSGNGSAYTADAAYGIGSPFDGGFVVQKGATTSLTITGLTNGTTYYLRIFTRWGTEWSTGSEITINPNTSTVLNYGDLAILSVNTDQTTGDEISFVPFKSIITSTTIDFTDNGYEYRTAGTWNMSEGTLRLTRTGSTLPAGTVVTFVGISSTATPLLGTHFNIFVNGANDNANWSITSLNGNGPFDLNVNDQIWIMQHGTWTAGTDHDATYSGSALYGWTATGWKTAPGYASTKGSTVPVNAICAVTNVAGKTNEDKVKYTGPTTPASKIEWIGRINEPSNWTDYADNTAFDNGIPKYKTVGATLSVLSGNLDVPGKWAGYSSTSWCDCANWKSLTVPTATDNVEIPADYIRNVELSDHADSLAVCRNLVVRGGTIFGKDARGKKITVNGDLIINGGTIDFAGTSDADGQIIVYGSFIDSTGGAGFIPGKSLITFTGGNNQSLKMLHGTGQSFYHMQVNKSGGAINLFNDLQVTDSLTFTAGKINGSTYTVTLGQSISNKGILMHTSGYVNGKLRRWFDGTNSGNQSGLFPVGTASYYRPITIEYTSAVASGGHLTTNFVASPMGTAGMTILAANSGGFGSDIEQTSNDGYWKVDNEAGKLTDGAYTFSATLNGATGITDVTKLTLVKRVGGGDWLAPGVHVAASGTTTAPTVSRTGLSGYSNFGLASGSGNLLPIELMTFKANCTNNKIEIRWTTATEVNNSHFVIERSNDSKSWQQVSQIEGTGNSSMPINYSLTDEKSDEPQLYRLIQVDFDGSSTIYGPIAVNCKNTDKTQISVYPNPFNDQLTINMMGIEDPYQVSIVDVNGKLIFEDQSVKEEIYTLNTTNLAPGVYMLKITDKGKTEHFKVIKN